MNHLKFLNPQDHRPIRRLLPRCHAPFSLCVEIVICRSRPGDFPERKHLLCKDVLKRLIFPNSLPLLIKIPTVSPQIECKRRFFPFWSHLCRNFLPGKSCRSDACTPQHLQDRIQFFFSLVNAGYPPLSPCKWPLLYPSKITGIAASTGFFLIETKQRHPRAGASGTFSSCGRHSRRP